jgi:probable F420-dependent oxidoreductase
MELGIAMFATDQTVAPDELGRLVEEQGFESLFLPEHTHIPTSRRTPFGGRGGELPEYYQRTLDPFVALMAAAAATERLRVGTGVLLVPEHDPIVAAKAVATLDLLSGGRFLFGIGAGWNEEEMENHGTDPATRFRLMRERVEAMKAIWTQDEAAHHGRLVDFDPIWSWPKPVQKPHPPVLVGGNGPRVLDRVLAYGDGWAPNVGRESALAERMAQLERQAGEAGRDSIPVTGFGVEHTAEAIARMAELGVARAVFWVGPGTRDEVAAEVEEIVRAAEGARLS